MSLTTPEKIKTLQRKLYAKAKAEPSFPFLPALRAFFANAGLFPLHTAWQSARQSR